MRILWTVNLIPKNLAGYLEIDTVVLGGWVEAMASQLSKCPDIELAVACKCEPSNGFDKTVLENVCYYSIPYRPSDPLQKLEDILEKIVEDYNPDIVQIEGTEFLHAKAMLNVGNSRDVPTVVSMQGILNGQYNYQCGQLHTDDLMFSKSPTEIYAGWYLHLRKTRWYKPRMKPEREIISSAKYILGRTTWDRAHTYSINPEAKYYKVSRVLREPFYHKNWDISRIERHSIYVGNGYLALKGLHFVIMALPQLIREYPDVKVYVAGNKPYLKGDKRPFYKKGFGAYIKKLIEDLNVENYIEFTGPLNADEVAEKLCKVNVYLLCSAVENSPNTLGEAMMVGTPSVAAYVGGVSDMATDGEEALFYRNDDPSLLAWNVKRIFDDDELAFSLSEKAKKRAKITHDSKNNAEDLMKVYNQIYADV